MFEVVEIHTQANFLATPRNVITVPVATFDGSRPVGFLKTSVLEGPDAGLFSIVALLAQYADGIIVFHF